MFGTPATSPHCAVARLPPLSPWVVDTSKFWRSRWLAGWYMKILIIIDLSMLKTWCHFGNLRGNDKTKIRAISTTIMVRSSPAKRESYNRTQEFNLLKNWRQMLIKIETFRVIYSVIQFVNLPKCQKHVNFPSKATEFLGPQFQDISISSKTSLQACPT